MNLTSRVKARSVQIAMVGMAVLALGALPAFADTPYHGGRAPQQQVMQWGRDTGCDARAPQWDRGGRRDARGCAMNFTHRDNRFDQHQDNRR